MTSAPVRGGDVSVVIASYNAERRLHDVLAAIAAQTVAPGEVVIADDHSTDDTAGVVESFRREHPGLPIHFVPSTVNTGNPATRNRAIEAATGSWIAICDDDDIWLPARLERQLDLLNGWSSERRLVAIGTWGVNVNDRLEPVSPAHMGPVGESGYDEAVARGGVFYCIHSSMLLDREEVRAIGGYRSEYVGVEDFELLARLGERGVITCIDEELVLFRKRLGSMSSSMRDDDATLRLVGLNVRRRRDGLPKLTLAEHDAQLAAAPWPRRLVRRLRATGKRHYRRGTVLAVNGHRARGAAHLAVAAALDWGRVAAGVRSVLGRRRR